MRIVLRLLMLAGVVFGGGVLLIKVLYGASWSESVEIADQFLEDALG